MKIAVFHELPRGGARRAVNCFSFSFRKINQVDLFITDERKELSENKYYTKIYSYNFKPKHWGGKNWRIRLYKDTIELYKLNSLHRKIARDIDSKNYDIVFVSASKYVESPFILKYLKTPYIFYCSDPSYRIIYDKLFEVSRKPGFFRYWYEKANRFFRKIIDRQNIRASKYFLAPSKFISGKFTEIYKKKCRVIYYGVDSIFFSPAKIKKDIDVFYIGSYDPMDGLDLLNEAIKHMKGKPKIRKLLAEDEWISDDRKLLELYRRSKIMVCTARSEGLGATALEAMSCGVPVIAVDEAGHRETVIDDKTGYLIPRDPKAMAEKIDWLLNNHEKLNELGKNARKQMVKNWSWEKRANEMEQVFKSIIK